MSNRKEPEKGETMAIALEYNKDEMVAPKVVATGRGYIAGKIMELAREYNIPVEKDPVLAEALGQLDLGQEIPPELYQVVAEVLVFIMEVDRQHGKGAR